MFATRSLTVKMASATALLTALIGTPAAAAPEVMTVCGSHQAELSNASGNSGFQLSSLSGAADAIGSLGTESLALTRDHGDFDLILNWHQADEHSLRAAGVDVLGMDLGGLVHLMVALSPEHIEHYLFTLDDDGSGDVLLSRGSSLRDDDALSLACTKPR